MKDKGGRPTVFDKERIEKLEEAFKLGCTDEEACLNADISTQALYKYQERNPKFLERKRLLKNNPFVLARTSIINAFKDDPNLALKYMERKKKDEFSLRQELTGADGEPVLQGFEIKINDQPNKS